MASAGGSATGETGAGFELAAAHSESIPLDNFTGASKPDDSQVFDHHEFHLNDSGARSKSDQFNWRNFDHDSNNSTGVSNTNSSSNGMPTVGDQTNTADHHFVGTYGQNHLSFADDGQGATIVSNAQASPTSQNGPAAGQQASGSTTIVATSPDQTLTGSGSSDTFVFASAPGHATITNFQPANDVIQIDHSIFANVQAVLTAAQDDGHGDVVITANAQNAITLQNMTLAQLQAHQSDFHIV
jgi:sarcosine oxidase gamma subunit